MGQCVACKTNKVRPGLTSESYNEQLENLHTDIVNKIHQLHKISLDCTNGIDACIAENNKPLAILLKCKYTHIKDRSKILQDTIKKIDDTAALEKSSKKKEVISESKQIIEDLQGLLLEDDVIKILEKSPEYLENIQNEIKKLGINIKEVEVQVENEFREKTSSPGRMKRRRYSKKLTNN
ncbi:hypothetical protein SteCoe_23063 [Stentor coeruleus]|uniref:Uncharacterized protein n=1 Tax=Stentor coeruleus TaxID=5963 RepID=A0A1R2BLE9_9CILI|nr:hypothetical protein SteCoe_23063 [Stentor coeruleus]